MNEMPDPKSRDDWTLPALREFFNRLIEEHDRRYESRFRSQEESVKAALAAVKEATDKQEANNERWRQNSNEWRAAMQDRENKFPTRMEMEGKFQSLFEKVDAIEQSISKEEGGINQAAISRSNLQYLIMAIMAGMSLINGAIGLLLYLIFRR